MGTFYSNGATKKDIIAQVTSDGKTFGGANDGGKIVTVAKALRGNYLWAVQERYTPSGDFSFRHIMLYMLSTNDGSWGYKPIPEGHGPSYYTCPLKYLEMTKAYTKYHNNKWRGKVREYAETQKRKRDQASEVQQAQA